MTSWDEVCAMTSALPGTIVESYYGKPAVKIAANGRAIVSPGREPDAFCLHIDRETIEIQTATDPDTFYQTPHYVGWDAVLVRYASPDPERVIAMIHRAHEQAAARPKGKPRRKP